MLFSYLRSLTPAGMIYERSGEIGFDTNTAKDIYDSAAQELQNETKQHFCLPTLPTTQNANSFSTDQSDFAFLT